jgi:hypothetical protein
MDDYSSYTDLLVQQKNSLLIQAMLANTWRFRVEFVDCHTVTVVTIICLHQSRPCRDRRFLHILSFRLIRHQRNLMADGILMHRRFATAFSFTSPNNILY